MLRKLLIWLAIAAVFASLAAGWRLYRVRQIQSGPPEGIVSGNGRIESVQVDVATKYAGRVQEILAREGDLVKPGEVVARMNTDELEAELARGKAKIAEGEETKNQIKAEILEKESRLKFVQQQFERDKSLFSRRVISREEMEQSQSQRDVATAALEASKAKLHTSDKTIEAAQAEVKRIEAQITDSTLKSPVEGRVLYRLAEEGEVLSAGGKVYTLVNLGDVYMEIFLPAQEAARVPIGADARIVVDVAPEYAARATVTFVSPEAQFTPKQVETRAERDKLMFRVKLRVPYDLMLPYIERVKTGVRGVGYIKINSAVPWPEELERRFPRPEELDSPSPKADSAAKPEPESKTEPADEPAPNPSTS